MSNRSSSHSANRVTTLHEGGVDGQAIWQRPVEQHDFAGRYSSLKRFVRRLNPGAPRATLRLEVDPGTEAPVEVRRPAARSRARSGPAGGMTLSCSRHQYAEIVFDQTIDTWLRLHRAAFDFFGASRAGLCSITCAPRSRTPPAVRQLGLAPARLTLSKI